MWKLVGAEVEGPILEDIGNNVGIFERTIINPSEKITIGHNVGIGGES